ncbi:protein kinase domain-containing protein [Citrus sinensis]|uniref:Protein kinase domain-containing protein n=3 Tax=Citrus TaxID=2706 RepID=A0ACB8MQQ8_CITSI|nr:hypothetical protein CICLE_v10019913mg [Citrus x clementina]KAH9731822.1 protein kinase domain-containing protein [Citrus sinensis]GAY51458.1 hypothetical protein CUMW_134330 [Citrus unshiu]KAH9732524.1 protein kinase domain-containing protein [Citrus sinensis]KAH9787745.1 protein kinase domain-containing protein [Citrus sinensis]
MSMYDAAFVNTELSKRTSIFGLRLWVVIGILLGSLIVLALFLLSLCLTSRRKKHNHLQQQQQSKQILNTPPISKEIQEIVHHPAPVPEIQVDIGKIEHRVVFSDRASSGESRGTGSACETASFGSGSVGPEVSHLGWGRWYTLRELEAATSGLCEENVIGEGGYGIVYRGILSDGTKVAVKNLLNNRLAYLHEGLEPKVVHRDVKSSNILLDRQWNARVSDFGLAKLLCSERSYVTTRVMGTFGYVAPEYACTGMLNEKSDVYSFGILIMEIITGRNPVDYSRPQGEVNLVDWLKTMVGSRKSEEVVDPKLPKMPASKALKRVLLVALRCVDPDATKRPKMGHVIHMLEADDLLFRDERRIGREPSNSYGEENRDFARKVGDKQLGEGASDTSEGDGSRNNHRPTMRR